MQIGRLPCLDDLPRKLVSDDLAQPPRCREQEVEIDSGVAVHAMQHVHQILGADVSRCARCEWAPAQPTETTLIMRYARGEPRKHIREAHATRVVKVQRELEIRP